MRGFVVNETVHIWDHHGPSIGAVENPVKNRGMGLVVV